MVFASPIFLFLFLPLVLAAYFALPRRWGNGALLAASLAFYIWGEGAMVALVLASVAFNWIMGGRIGDVADPAPRRRWLALAADTLLHFVDLRAPLRAAKGAVRLYYQTDSHWNYLGATIGYGAFMPEVAKLLPGLSIATVKRPQYVAGVDHYRGDLAQMLGLPAQFREDDIAPLGKILATPESRCAQLDAAASSPGIDTFVYRCPNPPRFSALIYRDSMGIPLQPMLAENFSRSTFVTSAQLDAGLVDQLRPDIVIEEMVERALTGIPYYAMRLLAK